MATPGEFIALVASATKIPEVTVGLHYRALREAGLVSKGGRGRSAPHVTPLDASRLLIALLGAQVVRDAPEVVRRLGRFTSSSYQDALLLMVRAPFPPAENDTLEGALAAYLRWLAGRTVNKNTVRQERSSGLEINSRFFRITLQTSGLQRDYLGAPVAFHLTRGLFEVRSVHYDTFIRVSRALMEPMNASW